MLGGRYRHAALCSLLAVSLALPACTPSIPPEALRLSERSLQQRELETRRFETADEAEILSASAAVLQDLGFTIDESETELGLIVGSKDRDATEAGQVAAAVVMAVLFGVYVPTDKNQKIRASLVASPLTDEQSTKLRVTFQRMVWNTQGQVTTIEALNEPKLYQEFFDRLAQSVFLEAETI
jgi:hypothetical protein